MGAAFLGEAGFFAKDVLVTGFFLALALALAADTFFGDDVALAVGLI